MNHRRRSITMILGLIALGVLTTGCSRISAGYVGIQSTVTGSERGLADVAVGPAWVFYNPMTSSVFEYPTFVQTAVWTHNKDEGHPVNEEISFTTKENMQVFADISLAYHVDASKVPAFYLKFRQPNIDTFTHGFLRNLAREKVDNIAGTYTIDQVMGDNAVFLKLARETIQTELTPYGIILDQFGFIGSPRPPATVVEGINAKLLAAQIAGQKQNEVAQVLADAAKQVAEAKGNAEATIINADAQAASNRKLSESITPTLVQYRMLDKWNGVMPTVQAGSGGLMLQLPASH